MQTISITTSRLRIRNLRPSDLADFHSYRSNPEVTKYQMFDVMTQEQSAEFIKMQYNKAFGIAGEWVQYGIEMKETGKIIGDCAIRLKIDDARIAEIGITISHREQRRGFAKETLNGVLSFLFDTQHVHRVVETVDAENAASIQLLKSLGFRQEGHFVESLFFKGKWGSELQFAMLKREWEALRLAET
ncbi:MAG: GNAT family N-acetyltransferase [Bacteroidetes bacterium]|nr:GNAT family N-acetyltransferase [Bacteroidota bacterium]MCW5896341.1 GNAT family N-acetyltransferase [Bacteroidota bacterium]